MADVQLSTLGDVIKAAYEGEADTNAFTDEEKTRLAELADSAGSFWSVNQDGHGFDAVTDIGMPVYAVDVGGSLEWVQATADSTDAIHYGVVSAVADANNFTVQQSGLLTGITFASLTLALPYYLADDGSLSTTPGTVDAPVLFATATDAGVILPFRAGANSGTLNWVSAPTTNTSTGSRNDINFDGTYLNLCVDTSTWISIPAITRFDRS